MFYSCNNLDCCYLLTETYRSSSTQFKSQTGRICRGPLTNQRLAFRLRQMNDQTSFPQIKITTAADRRQAASINWAVYSTLSAMSTKLHTHTHTHFLFKSQTRASWSLQSALTQTTLPVGGSGSVSGRVFRPGRTPGEQTQLISANKQLWCRLDWTDYLDLTCHRCPDVGSSLGSQLDVYFGGMITAASGRRFHSVKQISCRTPILRAGHHWYKCLHDCKQWVKRNNQSQQVRVEFYWDSCS